MTLRGACRALGYVLADVGQVVPWQALRCIGGRDLARRQARAAFAHDAAEGLSEVEAETEVHEPGLSPAAGASTGGSPAGAESPPAPPAGHPDPYVPPRAAIWLLLLM
ncbi:hypothetical protein MPUL_53600 [Mycolicibacterium pulveris]|uniref:Uncharacterized protein n=1 Tax=Mycolicibacterium pulveris TaxID=36813 RepID=A0A7I7URY7_MYCPV|nr:hypothetical protein [Mycolicibacterium pulveris]BBY84202.1 hypothetical protein MPUL_53600 [Mycolicibacterium pulveris]